MIMLYFLTLSVSIIFGTRRKNRVMGQKQLTCPRCNRATYHVVVRSQGWFALYFIPIIPLSKSTTVRCNICGYQQAVDDQTANDWFARGQMTSSMPQPIGPAVSVETGPSPQQLMDEAMSYYNAGRYSEAILAFDRVTQHTMDNAPAYFYKGNALAATGHFEEAIAAYNMAIQLAPNVGNAYHEKGRVLEHLGRIEEAHRAYDAGIMHGYKG